ncbi:hypothetical protein [Thermoproteus tenax]|nr:hypothetical protein [Thermoproteus tenax]
MDFSTDVSASLLRRVREIESVLSGVAEHHPYWPAAHYLTQALSLLFERWNGRLTQEELEEIKWYLEKAAQSLGLFHTS